MLTRAAVGFGAALLLALVVPHAAGRGRFGSEAAADRPVCSQYSSATCDELIGGDEAAHQDASRQT